MPAQFADLEPHERIIAAWDKSSFDREDQDLLAALAPHVGMIKIGLEAMTALDGISTVALSALSKIHGSGGSVMWDGKFNDIPNTVGAATRNVAKLGASMFTLHANAGPASIKAAVENRGDMRALGVTVLTSVDEGECIEMYEANTKHVVPMFASLLIEGDADGLVCSPKELSMLAEKGTLDTLFAVTPGIRAADAPPDDQKRTMTADEAIRAGATFLVIGRPILKADDPVDAAKRIADEIANAT